MDTVIFDVASEHEFFDRALAACKSGTPATAARISFHSPESMWRTLGEKRWAIVRAMAGAGEIGVRELARRVGRDVRAVHSDTRILLNAGVIDHTENNKLLFPYRHIKVQFNLDVGDATSTDIPPVHSGAQQQPPRSQPQTLAR